MKIPIRTSDFNNRQSYNTSIIDINLHGSSVGRLFSLQMLYWYTSPDNGDVSNMRDKNQQSLK